ncbi:MAG: hypothetical protein ACI81L_001168 [Verrucomicrobiales bacterium]|jgi:hypothetical protein
MDVEQIARQTDRLVWAVSDAVRAQREQLPACSAISAPTFGAGINLLYFQHDLTESLIRRRFIYRPENALKAFVDDLSDGEYFVRDGDRLIPTAQLRPVVDEVNLAVRSRGREFWHEHESEMVEASAMSRDVIDTGVDTDGLVAVAQEAAEPDDSYQCFWQRLSFLRLLRNEAHVNAWRPFELHPRDVEALTGAWAGTALQAPVDYSDDLVERGYVVDGSVTKDGLAARRAIEDATDDGVRAAFGVIDAARFLELVTLLPPWA